MEEKRCYGCMQLKTQSPLCEHCGYNENIDNLPHQLPLGTVLHGRYEVGKALGQGGFGITYIGYDKVCGETVAIKEYYPNGVVTRQNGMTVYTVGEFTTIFDHGKKRFLKEARAMEKLREVPGVVNVRDFFEERNTAYFIMEYVTGANLRQYANLCGGHLGAKNTLRLLKPVLKSLYQIHELGFIHRDISPDNIMVQSDGSLKLVDFGTARELDDPQINQMMTQSTQVVVKHGFAPMEQYLRNGNMGPWTDLYALCSTIYFCMTGQVPPDAPERVVEPRSLGWETIPGLTQEQAAALEQGMAPDYKKRTASVAELYQALYGEPLFAAAIQTVLPETEKARKETVTKPDPTPETVTISGDGGNGGRKKLLPWLIAAAAVVVLLVIGYFNIHIYSSPSCMESSNCIFCGKAGEAMLGHDWQPATCEEAKTCSRCGKTSGSALGHHWEIADCTAPATCSRCQETTGKATGHNWQAANCTAPKTCSNCKATEGKALGHDWKAATYTTPKTCRTCSATEGDVKGYVGTVSGTWGDRFARSNRATNQYDLSKKLVNCRNFTLNYNITKVTQGNVYGNFEVWIHTGDDSWEWESLGMFTLEDGQNKISVLFQLDKGVSFDSIAVICQAGGAYSYSANMSITEVQLYED